MRVVVTGSREWRDAMTIMEILDGILRHCTAGNELEVGVGDCPRGADAMVRSWCRSRGLEFRYFEARWKDLGKRAGPVRNRLMIDTMRPDLVLAFMHPTSKGTVDCAQYAQSCGYQVDYYWEEDSWPPKVEL